MNHPLPSLFATVAIVGTLVLSGCKPPPPEEEEPQVSTEVAVQVGKVTRTTIRARVEAYATVEPEPAGGGQPAGAARLTAPVTGVVLSIPVREGEHVEAGALIVKLDDRVAMAMAERARHALAFAEQGVERQGRLQAVAGTSQKAVEEAGQQLAAARAELAAATAQLSLVHLTSPLAGVVSRIHVQPGQAVDLNTTLAEIVDVSRLVLTAGIPALEASGLTVGRAVEVFSGNDDQAVATGTVSFVSPSVDVNTGARLVRMTLPKDTALRPGQFARVRIVREEREGRLAVPIESVVTDVEGHSVLEVVEGDQARRKPVKVGVRDGGWVEVEGDGLQEGDRVVTVGAYGLPKETKVHVLNP